MDFEFTKVSLEPLPVWVGPPIQPFINVQYGYYGRIASYS